MKKVCCLYRVSTKGQVDKDDIPMQKTSCRAFIDSKNDWKLYKEFYEKGISGFKVSAKDRDAIQDLQKMAIKKEFDVLLVFMFDRMGRKEDETPFVVEWFVNQGIEVWSVKEGQQRFEAHVDKLLNYIRFGQASGESIMTALRGMERMGQIVADGRFKGGTPAYGYCLVDNGRVNKRGRAVKDLAIDESAAMVVRYIFDLYVNHGLGTQLIANRLEAEGLLNPKGANFTCATIKNMISNETYRGVLKCGGDRTEPFEHLRIIDDKTFFKARDIAAQRSAAYQERRRIPRKVSKNCLLTGNIFCAHCGGRLITSTSGGKKKRKDGSYCIRRTWRYVCYNHMRHKSRCDGQSGYSAKRIDDAVSEAIRELLAKVKAIPRSKIVEERMRQSIKEKQVAIRAHENLVSKKERSLAVLKGEIANSLAGESSFSPHLLNEQILATQEELENIKSGLIGLESSLNEYRAEVEKLEQEHSDLIGYGEMFVSCDNDQKRMIICELVDEIKVRRGYEIELKLRFTFEQFLQHADKEILESEGYSVRIAEETVSNCSAGDMSFNEAMFELLESNPDMEWDDALRHLEMPIPTGQAEALDRHMMRAINDVREERRQGCIARKKRLPSKLGSLGSPGGA